jgi:GNAT superfamily N-acetyltransferase
MKTRIAAEKKNASAASRQLWAGLLRYNRQAAGPLRYTRTVLTVRDAKERIQGGVILQSYWKETYVELLWLSAKARRGGLGRQLMQEAERRARKRGSVLIHLNTYSFQAPGFYEKLGFRRFGGMEGSPAGASRHFYAKRLTR